MDGKETVKILVVAPLGIGGVSSMMVNIQKHLDRSKINFDYLTYHDRKEPQEETVTALGSRKLAASADEIPIQLFRRFVRMVRITKLCRKEQIKIIHFNASDPFELSNIIAARLGGVKHVTIHSHNAAYSNNLRLKNFFGNILKAFIPFFCNTYWGCSDLAARFLLPKSIIKEGNYRVISNGIELEKFDYNSEVRNRVRKELNVEGKFVVGHAGRFNIQKNHTFLIDIFNEIAKKDDSAVLLLFGVGELTDTIKEKVASLGLSERVMFMGASNRMPEMWQAMDVFIMPSLHEGLPVAGVEAQASGLPCIFADTITKEVDVVGNAAFLSLNDSVDTWAECALKYKGALRKSGVPELRKANYDIQQTADIFSEFYLNVAKGLDGNRI